MSNMSPTEEPRTTVKDDAPAPRSEMDPLLRGRSLARLAELGEAGYFDELLDKTTYRD